MHLLHHPPAAASLKNGRLYPFPDPAIQKYQNPSSSHSLTRKQSRRTLSCSGGAGPPLPVWPALSLSVCRGSERRSSVGVSKDIDVATLGNLCVDIVLSVPELPPKSVDRRKAYMDELSKSAPPKKYWEAGGNCNMAIAAARLGLRCASIGCVGDEIYGQFLLDVMRDEGIDMVGISGGSDEVSSSSDAYETLLCWVLVDPLQRHGFCSRADFAAEPAFSWLKKLSAQAKKAIEQSKVLFCNGYGFDELSPGLLVSALDYAVEVGTSVFFDPGPKGKTLLSGSPEEQRALDKFLRMSDVLLLTSEEAESLTGMGNPILAGQELLHRGTRLKWVIVKMGSKGSIMISMSQIACSPAFKVNVIDTVGCGDSFVAAIAFGFIHKLPLVHTLTLANAVGAATATGCGAGRNVANREQVLEIMSKSDPNEDDSFWMELLNENVDVDQITLLSEMSTNGRSSSRLSFIPLRKVVSDMLPKLENAQLERAVLT